jgi:GNAT superfamily N-acetyltransferase
MADALVRPAGPDDGPTLGRLQLDVWQQAYSDLLPAAALLADPDEQGRIWAERVTHGGPVLMAFEGPQPVGLAALEGTVDDDGYGQLELLHVLPRWSRRGHGGRLLAAAGSEMRKLGTSSGRWWAPETDLSVRQFLLGVGWSPDSARRVLDTGEGTFAEIRYSGALDLILV